LIEIATDASAGECVRLLARAYLLEWLRTDPALVARRCAD
jgi:hypothetical protein